MEIHTGQWTGTSLPIFQAWAQQLHGTEESHRRSGGKRFQVLAEAAGKDVLEGGQCWEALRVEGWWERSDRKYSNTTNTFKGCLRQTLCFVSLDLCMCVHAYLWHLMTHGSQNGVDTCAEDLRKSYIKSYSSSTSPVYFFLTRSPPGFMTAKLYMTGNDQVRNKDITPSQLWQQEQQTSGSTSTYQQNTSRTIPIYVSMRLQGL